MNIFRLEWLAKLRIFKLSGKNSLCSLNRCNECIIILNKFYFLPSSFTDWWPFQTLEIIAYTPDEQYTNALAYLSAMFYFIG